MATNQDVLKQLPNDRVRTALLEIIENNIPCKDYTLHIEKGSAKGDNYIGIVHRLIITYQQDETSKMKKIGVFIKVPPVSLVRREQFFARPCFLRESLIYNEYLPLLVEFQISKGIIPELNGFKEVVRCLKIITDDLEEAVFMEDAGLQGFVMNSRFENPSMDCVKLVIRALGKLHALSFALKDQWPDKFAKFKNLESIYVEKKSDKKFVNYLNLQKELAYGSISNECDAKYLQRVVEFFKDQTFFDRMLELQNGANAEPYGVICHGDCWINNILFKYEHGKPVDVKLIDWQVAGFGTPACDLMYFIFCCMSKSMRDEYYEFILDEYYSELSNFLKSLGSDPIVLFPRAALNDHLKKFGSYALIIGIMAIPTIMTKQEDVPDLDEISDRMDAGDEEYTKKEIQQNLVVSSSRIRDVIIDLVNLEYI